MGVREGRGLGLPAAGVLDNSEDCELERPCPAATGAWPLIVPGGGDTVHDDMVLYLWLIDFHAAMGESGAIVGAAIQACS